MNSLARALLTLSTACVISLTTIAAPANAITADRAATTPQVVFKKVQTQCSPLIVDGQKQEQCMASFTATASKAKTGYKVIVIQAPLGSTLKRTVGKFTVKGTETSKRFKGDDSVVCRYGSPKDPQRLKFYAVVKDTSGETVLKTKPRTLC